MAILDARRFARKRASGVADGNGGADSWCGIGVLDLEFESIGVVDRGALGVDERGALGVADLGPVGV
jgi:hypothetical protein